MKKLCICCSLSFTNQVLQIAKRLEELGFEVLLPNGLINRLIEKENFNPVRAKVETDSCHLHVDKIRESDAVLMCNFTKNGIEDYIGANSFAELFVAKYFDKPIYAFHSLPDQSYINEELESFNIKVINEKLEEIKV